MHFSRMIHAGTVVASLAFGVAAMPAQAQGNLHVIDAQGHQVGILVPVQNIPATPSISDIAMFDALDRMMTRDIAVMEAADRELTARLVSTLRAVPAIEHGLPKQVMSEQRVEAVSIGRPSASCTQTIMMTSNGQSAPIVHVSSTGGKACSTLVSSLTVGKPESQKPEAMTLTPAVDTRKAGSVNEHAGSVL